MHRTHSFRRSALAVAGLLAIAASTPELRGAAAHFHTQLIKSEPASNDTLASPPRAVRLWFTERVELAVTTVKLAGPAGAPVPLEPLARPDTGRTAPIVANVSTPLGAGTYIVTWSTAARDGHPAKGTFGFVVKAAR